MGLTLTALQSKCWRRIGRGLYCWSGLKPDPLSLLVAWRDLLPPGAVFAGLTAAWLFRLDVDPCNPIEVIGPWARSRKGVHVRHCLLEKSDVTTVRGLLATTLRRTFDDLRRRLEEVELLVLADQALRLNLGRFHELAEPAESPMETRLRWTLLKAGLPAPQVQARASVGRISTTRTHDWSSNTTDTTTAID